MPRPYKGHKFILAVIDEVTTFMVTMIEHVFSKYSITECMILDQDSAFISTLINYLFKKLGIKLKGVGPSNHQSL